MTILRWLVFFAASSLVVAQGPGLKIVVVAGEDAVNIIQQKTAVAPIVEVRDRNDQPVAGAIVNFAIRGGRATFGGARTLSVTTDIAGRAIAGGFTPTASGAVQIGASAAFQGQTAAAVTITQTNVMTAAQAAAVSGAAGSSSGGTAAGTSAGAAGGGGGGLSATTIGIIGGAVAGGTVVATKVIGGSGLSYSGPWAFDWVVGCMVERMAGTLVIDIDAPDETPSSPISSGSIEITNGSSSIVSRPAGCNVLGNGNWGMPKGSVSGTVGNLAGHGQDTVTSQVGQPLDRVFDFQGGLQNGTISGTFTMTWRSGGQFPLQSTGTATVTLGRQ